MRPPLILLLAGAAMARSVAERLTAQSKWYVIGSIAGVTPSPRPLPCKTRIGGFGGAEGLARWLRDTRCSAVIDATHRFAAQITTNAITAASATQTPYLRVETDAWRKPANATWIEVDSHQEAASAVPTGARALLTTGAKTLRPYAERNDVWWTVRVIDATAATTAGFPSDCVIASRPPFDIHAEIDVMRTHRITHLIAKNAGGEAARPKIDAAAQLGVSAVLVRPHAPPSGVEVVRTVDAVVEWLEDRLG